MKAERRRRGFFRTVAALPAAALAILPSAHCPFCLGAYGALVSSLGLGFLLKESVLAPLIIAFLISGIVSVAWTMRSHRRWAPLLWTIGGSMAIAAGRLIWSIPVLVYAGGAIVLVASLWNLWLKRPAPEPLVTLRISSNKGETSWPRERSKSSARDARAATTP